MELQACRLDQASGLLAEALGNGAADARAHRRHGGDLGELHRWVEVPLVFLVTLTFGAQHGPARRKKREQ